ncbi:MAG: hypothetical protein FJZ67_03600 [Bacteroidetes bacterium]|nr:hypothetical protein [Bacteroidota bacterium]
MIFTLKFIFLNFPENIYSIKGDNDFYFYAKTSQGLIQHHSENVFKAIGNTDTFDFPVLYHYGDLYLNAFSKLIFYNVNYTASLALIIYPFLISVTLLFIIGEIKNSKSNFQKSHWAFIVGILIILGWCFLIHAYDSPLYNLVKIHFDRFLFDSKNLMLFPIIFLIFLSINYKSYQNVIPLSIFGICMYSTSIPALFFLSVFVLFLSFKNFSIQSWNSMLISLKSERKIIFSFVIMCLFILAIMTLTKAFENVKMESIPRSWTTMFIMLLEYTFSPFLSSPVILFIFALLLYNSFKEKSIKLEFFLPILSALFVFFCCAIFIVKNHENPEIRQTVSTISGPILISLITIYLSRLATVQVLSIAILLVILSSFNFNEEVNDFNKNSREELSKKEFSDLNRIISREFLISTKWIVIGPKVFLSPNYSFNDFYYPFMEFDNVNVPIDMSYYFYSDVNFKFSNSKFFKPTEIQSLSSLGNCKTLIKACKKLNIKFILFIKKDFLKNTKIINVERLYDKGDFYLYRIN